MASRFLNIEGGNFVDDFVYQSPFNLIQGALAANQYGFDTVMANAGNIEGALSEVLSNRFIDTDEQRQQAISLNERYNAMINDVTEAMRADPMNWRSQSRALDRVRQEIAGSFKHGELFRLRSNREAYDAWAQTLASMEPERARAVREYTINRFRESNVQDTDARFEGLFHRDLNDSAELTAILRQLPADLREKARASIGQGDFTGWIQNVTETERTNYGQVIAALEGFLQDPDRLNRWRTEQQIGLATFFDEYGNLLDINDPRSSAHHLLSVAAGNIFRENRSIESYQVDAVREGALNREHAARENALNRAQADRHFHARMARESEQMGVLMADRVLGVPHALTDMQNRYNLINQIEYIRNHANLRHLFPSPDAPGTYGRTIEEIDRDLQAARDLYESSGWLNPTRRRRNAVTALETERAERLEALSGVGGREHLESLSGTDLHQELNNTLERLRREEGAVTTQLTMFMDSYGNTDLDNPAVQNLNYLEGVLTQQITNLEGLQTQLHESTRLTYIGSPLQGDPIAIQSWQNMILDAYNAHPNLPVTVVTGGSSRATIPRSQLMLPPARRGAGMIDQALISTVGTAQLPTLVRPHDMTEEQFNNIEQDARRTFRIFEAAEGTPGFNLETGHFIHEAPGNQRNVASVFLRPRDSHMTPTGVHWGTQQVTANGVRLTMQFPIGGVTRVYDIVAPGGATLGTGGRVTPVGGEVVLGHTYVHVDLRGMGTIDHVVGAERVEQITE